MIGLVQVHSERTKKQFHDARGEVSYPEKKYDTLHDEGFSIRTLCTVRIYHVYVCTNTCTIHMYSN